MAIKIWTKKAKDDGSTYIRLEDNFGDITLYVVDHTGVDVLFGSVLTITEDGIKRHKDFNFEGLIDIATKNGYVKQTKD